MKAVYFICNNHAWGHVAATVWAVLEEEGFFQECEQEVSVWKKSAS